MKNVICFIVLLIDWTYSFIMTVWFDIRGGRGRGFKNWERSWVLNI